MPCIPVRNFEWEEEDESGRVIILRPKYLFKPVKQVIEPLLKNKFFRIKLDELGSLIWRNCDGQKTVEELARILIEKFGPEFKEPYQRLAKFIMHLGKDKFIEINCPVAEDPPEGKTG